MDILSIAFAFIIGCLFGNYASTLLYRLPAAIPIGGYNQHLGQVPHCSNCNHPLKFYEYFPILSWVSTGGSCNYCGYKINKDYTILELSSGILAIILLWKGGFSEIYLLMLLFGVLLLLAVLLNKYSAQHARYVLVAVGILGVIFRTLNDGSVLPVIYSAAIAYFGYVGFTRKAQQNFSNDFNLNLLLVAGIWLSMPVLLIYGLLLGVIKLFFIHNRCLPAILLYCLVLNS